MNCETLVLIFSLPAKWTQSRMLTGHSSSRIFIMNASKLKNDDELEEGEIDDDELVVRVETKSPKKGSKSKKLPKRYMLNHPNKEWSVKKKKCNRKHSHDHSSHHDSVKNVVSRKAHAQCRHNGSNKHTTVRTCKNAHKKAFMALRDKNNQEKKCIEKSTTAKRHQNTHVVDKPHFPVLNVGTSRRTSHSFSERATKQTPKRRFSVAGCASDIFKCKSPAVVDKNASYEVLLAQYKVLQNELDSIKHPDRILPKATNPVKVEEKKKNSVSPALKDVNGKLEGVCQKILGRKSSQISEGSSHTGTVSAEELNNHVEDEDDLQALRQQALASCMDNIARKTKSKSLRKSCMLSLRSTSESEPLNVELRISADRVGLKGADNYDLVDMEIESDDELSAVFADEVSKNSQIIYDAVVDTFHEEEELDEEVLRAKLIQSLGKKKIQNEENHTSQLLAPSPESCVEVDVDVGVLPVHAGEGMEVEINDIPVLNSRTHSCTDPVLCNLPAEENNPPVSVTNSNSLRELCTESNQSEVRPRILKKIPYYNPQKPIVINLKEDSSSEGSDAEGSHGGRSANAIASLELLVKDARHESDSVETQTVVAPGAVACLSKAQQQEYNKLKEIIAKKECNKVDSKVMVTALQDLQVLERKLNMQKAVLEKRNQVLNELRVQAAKEKIYNEKVLVTISELKKQLRLAEGKKKKAESSIRALHNRIRTIKSENERHQGLICDLEINCRKLGLHTKGPSYSLPVPSPITSTIIKKAI